MAPFSAAATMADRLPQMLDRQSPACRKNIGRVNGVELSANTAQVFPLPRPWRHNAVHPGMCDRLPQMLDRQSPCRKSTAV
ncbi:MAG: hypothetical protein WDO73_30050 [Ignavibacteriota bacterium]